MGDLDELPGRLIELRELIKQAHGVIKDMDRLIREHREITRTAALSAREQAQAAAQDEMKRFQKHIQGEMDRSAKDLNRAVQAARYQVIKALTVSELEELPNGEGLRVRFAGNLFDAGEKT